MNKTINKKILICNQLPNNLINILKNKMQLIY